MIAIYPYQTQEVRDLAWACFSPVLLHARQLADHGADVADCALALTPDRQLWLEHLDRDATPLLDYLSQRPTHRLGVYFEHLWQFFLREDPHIELIAHNLPVHHQGRTIGEFDCLYYCHERRRHYHLELTIKYFLGLSSPDADQSSSAWRQWLGPNARDRLDIKIEHLMQRQTRLGDNPVARAQLLKLAIPDVQKELAFKGYLFQPSANPPPPPGGFNHGHEFNQWVSVAMLQAHLAELEANTYLVLPKMHWLSRAICPQQERALSAEHLQGELCNLLQPGSSPRLVAALDRAGFEQHRFFVTPAGWPDCEPDATAGNTAK